MRAEGRDRVSLLRKLLHLAMAVIPAAGWRLAPWSAIGLTALFLGASLIVEAARRDWLWVNRLLWRLLPSAFREGEARRILGSTWFAAGAFVTLLAFGMDAGGTAVLFLAWGDPLAEVVGRWRGGGAAGKTWAGSAACLAACVVAAGVGVSLGGLHPGAALLGAGVSTLVERWSPPPDDNVWMPVISGLAIWIAGALLGG